MGAQLTLVVLTLHPERLQTATLGGGAGRLEWSEQVNESVQQMALEIEKYGFSPFLCRHSAWQDFWTPQSGVC